MMNQISTIRKSKGLTMGKLAEITGVSPKTISTYETTPPSRPRKNVLEKISHALGVPVDDLITNGKKGRKSPAQEPVIKETKLHELTKSELDHLRLLVNNEMKVIQQLIIETAQVADSHPALNKSMDIFSGVMDRLKSISDKLA